MGDKLKKFKPRNVIAASMHLSRKGGGMKDWRDKRERNKPDYSDWEDYDGMEDSPSCNDQES